MVKVGNLFPTLGGDTVENMGNTIEINERAGRGRVCLTDMGKKCWSENAPVNVCDV